MNKSEKQKLGRLVATMCYSYNSEPPVIDAGREILEMFPALKPIVEQYKRAEDIENLTKMIRHVLPSYNRFEVIERRYKELIDQFPDGYYSTLKAIVYDFIDKTLLDPAEISEDLDSNCHEARIVAKDLLFKHPQWLDSVELYFYRGSIAYQFTGGLYRG